MAGAGRAAEKRTSIRGALLLLGWLWVALSVLYAVGSVFRGLVGAASTDFVGSQLSGHLLGQSCMYCPQTQYRAELSMLGKPSPAGMVPFVDPPPVAYFMRPFAQLSLTTGLLVFDALSVGAMIVSAILLYRLLRPEGRRSQAVLLSAGAAFLLPGSLSLAYGNWDGLCLLVVTVAAALLSRRADASAGLVLSLALVKPQLVWLVVPALVIAQRWRFVAGFAVGAAAWLVATLAMVGFDGVRRWVSLVDAEDATELPKTAGLPTFTPGAVRLGYVTAVVLALLAVWALWRFRHVLRAQPVAALGAGVTASLLCAPHLFEQDFLLLAVPITVWASTAPRTALRVIVAIGVASLLDQALTAPPAHAATLVVLGATLVAVSRTWHAEPRDRHPNLTAAIVGQ